MRVENLVGAFGQVHNLDLVKTVTIDKDINELHSAQKAMPNASVQLCKFHVTQSFAREIRKCGLDQSKHQKLTTTVSQMVFAKSDNMFKKARESFKENSPDSLMEYYEKKWSDSMQMWCAYHTNSYINLGNSTNNRLESLTQKVKFVLDRYMSVAEVIRNLMLIDRTHLYLVTHTLFMQKLTVPYQLNNDDPSIDAMVKTFTPYAAGIAIKELKKARGKLKLVSRKQDQLFCKNCHGFTLSSPVLPKVAEEGRNHLLI